MTDWGTLLAAFQSKKNILLTGHSDPDGDCLGAIAGLYYLWEGKRGRIKCIIEGPVPDRLSFLLPPGIMIIEDDTQEPIPDDFDLAVVVDSSDLKRLGRVQEIVAGRSVINIDHHPDNEFFGDINLVEVHASSACEILGLLLQDKIFLPRPVMEAWAAGILYDTGGLKHPNTRAQTLQLLGTWMVRGLELAPLQEKLFARQSPEALALYQKALERIKIEARGLMAWTVIEESPDSVSAREISQKVIDEIRGIRGVEVAVLFVDQGDKTRVSLRSKNFPVNDIAARWGGGGHIRAAGVTRQKPWTRVYPEVLAAVEGRLDEWNN